MATKKTAPAKKKEKWSVDKELSDWARLFIIPLEDVTYMFGKKKKK